MAQKKLILEYQEFDSESALAEDEKQLVNSAWEARHRAYAPYSHFTVGAAVLTKDGKIFQGNNQETANYKGSCAERVALDTLGAAGLKNQVFKIAIVGGRDNSANKLSAGKENEEPVSPCGQCRQDLKEFEDLSREPITIILASRKKIRKFVGIGNLLPFAFGPLHLGIASFRSAHK
jgi:cytidine deaminase